jgi:hypothetical protein
VTPKNVELAVVGIRRRRADRRLEFPVIIVIVVVVVTGAVLDGRPATTMIDGSTVYAAVDFTGDCLGADLTAELRQKRQRTAR